MAEVLKIFLTDLQLQDLFDHRNEVCQRTDRTQRRRTVWPDHSSRRCQNERVLNRFKRHTALVQLAASTRSGRRTAPQVPGVAR